MKDCIFCKIVAGEIPCKKIWEDEYFLAFLTIEPLSEGHTLVIPKKHFRWVWDLPAGRQSPNFGGFFEVVKVVKKVLDAKYQPEFMELKIFGVDVPHAHIHLIPHYENLTS